MQAVGLLCAARPSLPPAPHRPATCRPAVLDARLSRMGVPLLTLSDCRAYAWSAGLEGWGCVADESFGASQYLPMLSLAGQGEPERWVGLLLAALL